jgi:hypothetical protein
VKRDAVIPSGHKRFDQDGLVEKASEEFSFRHAGGRSIDEFPDIH